MNTPPSPPRIGALRRLRVRLFGEPDPVADQLRELERQGTIGARVAHVLAFLLILLFSLGSLVALGGDALQHAVTGWQSGQLDLPAVIALGVTTLLVPAMDAAMLYAASMLRLLASRRAEPSEKRLHAWVIIGVSVVEAATYCYMSYRYEQPADALAWALIAARALASPLLAIYLSMARPLPVTPRDILYQVEMATGLGVIRDAVQIANDHTAPLARKMALYGASAVMTAADRSRLDQMISVMQEPSQALPAPSTEPLPPAIPSQGKAPKTTPAPYDPSRPPTGPGSPATAHPSHTPAAQADSLPAGVTDETEQDDDEQENSRVLHIRRSRSARAANARKRREEMHARRNVIREAVHAIMDLAALHGEAVDALSIREIVRRVNASGRLGSGIQTSAKTVKPHIASWLRDQQRVAAK